MKIGIINSYQSFKANDSKKTQKSFMGRITESFSGAIDGVTNAIDTTSKAAESISEIARSAGNIFKTPEEATIIVLTDQIDNKVVNNEKYPEWLRKTAAYGTAGLAATGTFIAVRKTPGVIKRFMVKNLCKFELGKKILRGYGSAKKALGRFMNMLGKERIGNILSSVGSFISEKTPNFIKKACKKVKLDKLKNLSFGDYVKNTVALILGYQTGEKVLNKNQGKFNTTKTDQKHTEKVSSNKLETVEEDIDYSEAA